MTTLDIPMHTPVLHVEGCIFAVHDVACAVCGEQKAVYQINRCVFLPCWTCQGKGWELHRRSWLVRAWRWLREEIGP